MLPDYHVHRLSPTSVRAMHKPELSRQRIVTDGEISESLSSDQSVYAVRQLLATAGFVDSAPDMAWCRRDLLHIAG
jgi:hypothetical protein